jgi:hypothetical protein
MDNLDPQIAELRAQTQHLEMLVHGPITDAINDLFCISETFLALALDPVAGKTEPFAERAVLAFSQAYALAGRSRHISHASLVAALLSRTQDVHEGVEAGKTPLDVWQHALMQRAGGSVLTFPEHVPINPSPAGGPSRPNLRVISGPEKSADRAPNGS